MSSENETTTYPAARPTTRRPTQRSNPRRPEHENSRPSNQTMKFQPQSQSQDRKSGAHRGITIRWGVRADARRQTHTSRVDLVRGW
jgi:hypothetical protein